MVQLEPTSKSYQKPVDISVLFKWSEAFWQRRVELNCQIMMCQLGRLLTTMSAVLQTSGSFSSWHLNFVACCTTLNVEKDLTWLIVVSVFHITNTCSLNRDTHIVSNDIFGTLYTYKGWHGEFLEENVLWPLWLQPRLSFCRNINIVLLYFASVIFMASCSQVTVWQLPSFWFSLFAHIF